MLDLLSPILNVAGKALDKIVPDADLRDKIKFQLQNELLSLSRAELQAATAVVVAEAQGESWLQRNWRPITMLGMMGLVASYWFGFTGQNISDQIIGELFQLVQIGLGGYVVGRSGEKIAKVWKENGN